MRWGRFICSIRSGGMPPRLDSCWQDRPTASITSTFPTYLREAGYYCTNHTKTDYNVGNAGSTWDGKDKYGWRKRAKGQPFFCVINFTNTHESKNWPRGGQHASQIKSLKPKEHQDPATLELPPYYADRMKKDDLRDQQVEAGYKLAVAEAGVMLSRGVSGNTRRVVRNLLKYGRADIPGMRRYM